MPPKSWELMQDPATHVYLAGLGKVAETFDKIMEEEAGGAGSWRPSSRKSSAHQGRWSELIYS